MSAGERVPLVTAQPVAADFVRAYPILIGVEGERDTTPIICSSVLLFSYLFLALYRSMPKGYPKRMERVDITSVVGDHPIFSTMGYSSARESRTEDRML